MDTEYYYRLFSCGEFFESAGISCEVYDGELYISTPDNYKAFYADNWSATNYSSKLSATPLILVNADINGEKRELIIAVAEGELQLDERDLVSMGLLLSAE